MQYRGDPGRGKEGSLNAGLGAGVAPASGRGLAPRKCISRPVPGAPPGLDQEHFGGLKSRSFSRRTPSSFPLASGIHWRQKARSKGTGSFWPPDTLGWSHDHVLSRGAMQAFCRRSEREEAATSQPFLVSLAGPESECEGRSVLAIQNHEMSRAGEESKDGDKGPSVGSEL